MQKPCKSLIDTLVTSEINLDGYRYCSPLGLRYGAVLDWASLHASRHASTQRAIAEVEFVLLSMR